MTLTEARTAIGRTVIYRTPRARETGRGGQEGVITSVNDWYVFVRYGPFAQHSQATSPEDLEFAS